MSIKFLGGVFAGVLILAGLIPAPAAEGKKPLLVDQVREGIKNGAQFLRDVERGRGNWEVDKTSITVKGGWSCLAMLALLNSGEVRLDDPIIERGLEYLRQIEPEKTYEVGLQTMVFAEAGRIQDRERIQRNVNWLIDAMVKRNGECRGWTYFKGGIAP